MSLFSCFLFLPSLSVYAMKVRIFPPKKKTLLKSLTLRHVKRPWNLLHNTHPSVPCNMLSAMLPEVKTLPRILKWNCEIEANQGVFWLLVTAWSMSDPFGYCNTLHSVHTGYKKLLNAFQVSIQMTLNWNATPLKCCLWLRAVIELGYLVRAWD